MPQSCMRLGKVRSKGDCFGERRYCVVLQALQLPYVAEIVVEDRQLRLECDCALERRRGLRQVSRPEVADAEIIVGPGIARREPDRFQPDGYRFRKMEVATEQRAKLVACID